MAFDFPSSPTNGQQFTPSGGPTFVWNGYAWDRLKPSLPITIADTAPASGQGNLWWESDGGALWISYNDGNTTQWVNTNGGVNLPVTKDGAVALGRLDAMDARYITKLDTQRIQSAGKFFTFSENDLRVTKTAGGGTWYNAYSQPASVAWEMLYFEATIMQIGADGVIIGIANKGYGPDYGGFLGQYSSAFGWQGSGWAYCYHAAGYYWNLGRPTFTTGDTIAIAVHVGINGLWMRNVTTNGYWWGQAADNPGGSPPVSTDGFIGFGYSGFISNTGPLYAACCLNDLGTSVRFNFDGPFLGTVPTGYKKWRGRS